GGDSGDGTGGDGTGGDGSDVPVCAEVDVNFDAVIPTVVVLIDQSGSMTENFSGQERWTAVYNALMANDGLITTLQSQVRFGLALYTYNGGNMCPDIISVNPALDNRDPIDTVYSPERPQGDTPTGDAIDAIMPMFADNPTGGPQIILLATDGEPDTCEQPNPQNGHGEAIAAA